MIPTDSQRREDIRAPVAQLLWGWAFSGWPSCRVGCDWTVAHLKIPPPPIDVHVLVHVINLGQVLVGNTDIETK